MFKLKSAFCLLLLAVLCHGVFADDSLELKRRLTSFDAFKADFFQHVTRSDGSSVSDASGKIFMKKPDRLLMHTIEPDEQVLFTKGSDVYFYDPFVNQVSIFDKSQLYNSPFMLISSDNSKLWDRYEVTKNGDSYTLIPKQSADIKSLELNFSGSTIVSLSAVMRDGNINIYKLSEQSNEVKPSDFDYQVPKDAEVDDERSAN